MPSKHPYIGLPDYQFWKNEPAIDRQTPLDPVTKVSFSITPEEPVVTAGSCFAQHVANALQRSGFNFMVTEQPHAMIPRPLARKHNYMIFSARYGNVYTARQLKQLLQRAYGLFEPEESVWNGSDGSVVDPFRPQIQPGGFVNAEELERDREYHLDSVRKAIESLSVFVFTLGLTEAWIDKRDGTVFPLAPGVAGGTFDEKLFAFENFGVESIVEDMQWSLDFIRSKNPGAKFVITVSPVPLNATYADRHVWVSTTYSKAVLRVAAEQITSSNELCDYFPSYEIITSPFARGRYYLPDCRGVKGTGVNQAMRVFLRHYGGEEAVARLPVRKTKVPLAVRKKRQAARKAKQNRKQDSHISRMENMLEVLCDEESISNK
ncbi:MAG: GSCFA domain-containing protein [Rhodospirillales bacterium]